MLRKPVSIVISVALLGWSAQAATLTNVEGAVSVNRGSGFKQVAAGAELNPGDRVRTGAGSADIVYANGCASRLGPDQLAVVLATPPSCGAGAGGLADGPAATGGPSTDTLIVGGVIAAAAAGVGIALATSNSDPASSKSDPASP